MKAADVMTRNVFSIPPDAPVMQAVRIMLQHHISGLPVIDAERNLLGIVTEGDLLRRVEIGTQRRRARWLEFLIGPGRLASEYAHACGRRVHEVMTKDVLTVAQNTPLADIVKLMERHRVKRVPVVDIDGNVIGIVTRANLLRALASVAREVQPHRPTTRRSASSSLPSSTGNHGPRSPWSTWSCATASFSCGAP